MAKKIIFSKLILFKLDDYGKYQYYKEMIGNKRVRLFPIIYGILFKYILC
jgi:hypothetical protein